MAEHELNPILNRIRRLAADVGGVSDAQLLERFVTGRDEAAFELLVWRHARLVFGVCRRVLADHQDAEDAFQATFLALARRAGRITNREAVASWLYRVAYRVALTARGHRARQAAHERPMSPAEDLAPPANVTDSLERQELRAVLDQELSRLPERFRAPVVLCYLEGKTVDEAAVHLGCPRGTVASRLARARERLRVRLAGRGLALAAGLALGNEAGHAAPFALIPSVIAAAVGRTATGGSIPPRAVALSQEVLQAMFLNKLRTAAALAVVCVGVLLAGAGWGLHLYADAGQDQPPAADQPPPQKAAVKTTTASPVADKPAPVTVTVSHPVQTRFTPSLIFNGRLEPLHVVEVKARVSGELLKVCYKPGTEVKRGDLLFEIDPRVYQLAVDKAKANLDLATAKKQNADARLKRVRNLSADVTPQTELANAVAEATVAEAASKVARVDLERAQLELSFTKVVAPVSGRIDETRVSAGNQVSGTPGNATLLATIRSIDPIRVAFDIDERSFLEYQSLLRRHEVQGDGSPLSVSVAGAPLKGMLEGFSASVNPSTGTVRVRGRLANPGWLLPGMFVQVRMPFGKERTVLEVPEEAVIDRSAARMQGDSPGRPRPVQTDAVLVVNGHNRVEEREVELGPRDDAMRVIEKGLTPEDWVVPNRRISLQPGQTVKPERRRPRDQKRAGNR